MKFFKDAIKEIAKDDIIEYYITENHTWKESAEHFCVGGGVFAKLLKTYGIKKPTSLHSANIAKAKLDKYGDPTYNNRDMAAETCIKKYGVDNIFKDNSYIKERFKEKYGVDHPMKVDSIKEKVLNSRDIDAIMEKSRNTYFDRTGYDNPFSNPEVIKK